MKGGIFNLVNLHVYHYAGNNPVRYTDPDGEALNLAAAGIGALLGAGIAIASGKSGQEIAAAAVGGAATGGMAGLTMGGSLAVQVAGGALAGSGCLLKSAFAYSVFLQ